MRGAPEATGGVQTCRACGGEIAAHSAGGRREAKFCSNACRQRAYRQRVSESRAGAASTVGLLEQLGSFVGREDELLALSRYIRDDRLVTVTGAPGAGKTRLAVEAAAVEQRRARHHVIYVELASISDPDKVMSRVEAELKGTERDGDARLLVLDNCEHVLSGCSRTVNAILSRHPDLRVLATSREPLRLPGEVVHVVDGLPCEDADDAAVRLFVERAAAVVPGFELTDDNAADVREICARLDGLPLMVELAALRVRAFPVAEIVRRLGDSANLLTTGWATAPPRHQSLRAAVGWSYDRLAEPERALARTTSALRGEFGVTAAATVAAAAGIDAAEVPELLASLESKSLIAAVPGSDEARFRMSGSVRHVAREHLADRDEAERARELLADWIVAATGDFAQHGVMDGETADFVRIERGHVEQVLGWLRSRGDDRELLLAAAADAADLMKGKRPTASGRAAEALESASAANLYRGVALATAAVVSGAASDFERAECFARQAIATSSAAPHDFLTSRMSVMEYFLSASSTDLADLRARLRVSTQLGDTMITVLCLYAAMRSVVADLDLLARRSSAVLAVLELVRESGLTGPARCAEFVHGLLLCEQERYEEAEERFSALLDESVTSVFVGFVFTALGRAEYARALSLLVIVEANGIDESVTGIEWLSERLAKAEVAARNALSESAAEQALAAGEALSGVDAVRFARREAAGDAAQPKREGRPLSDREQKIASLVAKGLTNRQIAAQMYLSVRTVETHLRNIRTARGLNTRAHLAAWYSRHYKQQRV
ncbi:ATP-binding protein [Saccharopolyspora flava]|uniref:Predicted ATPase n=1 Tax=Saccharopolyspora flava TaxID=95161 RepID=A0A1I6TND5_9PSEU|nr:LuxR C-terminal-related transcriptional regulator [Saccharopolyspora flava]SFS90716.1 Predicted ATPase [Saccharopolyspora flava]